MDFDEPKKKGRGDSPRPFSRFINWSEDQNCLHMTNGDRSIVPLRPGTANADAEDGCV